MHSHFSGGRVRGRAGRGDVEPAGSVVRHLLLGGADVLPDAVVALPLRHPGHKVPAAAVQAVGVLWAAREQRAHLAALGLGLHVGLDDDVLFGIFGVVADGHARVVARVQAVLGLVGLGRGRVIGSVGRGRGGGRGGGGVQQQQSSGEQELRTSPNESPLLSLECSVGLLRCSMGRKVRE